MITAVRARVHATPVVGVCARFLQSPFASLQLLLASGVGLLLFGLMMAASTTISASTHSFGPGMWTQLIREFAYLLVSVPVFWAAVRMPPRWYRRLVYPVLLIALSLLVAVLAPGIGVRINGAQRWIALGPITVQPSEFAKLAVLLWGADLLARKQSLNTLTAARHILIPLVPCFMLIIALVMTEPDLGTTLCFVLLLLGLLWMVGLPMRYFLAMLTLVAGSVTALAVTEPYRLQRLTTFLHPNLDPGDTGYHTIQGLYALASGGWFGVGLGQGTSKYGWVPNANTDYVFAVVGEELGLVGCLAVLLLFAAFTFSAVRIAHRSSDAFVRLVASGTAVWIAGQALINVGYVTALLPVTGIPLPFISNGGTSLLLTCAVLGMLTSFARHEPEAVVAANRLAATGRLPRWVRLLRLSKVAPIDNPGRRVAAGRTSSARPAPAAGRVPRTASAVGRAPRTASAVGRVPRTASGADRVPRAASSRSAAAAQRSRRGA